MQLRTIIGSAFLATMLLWTATIAAETPAPAADSGENPYRITTDKQSVTIFCEEKPALKYLYADVPYKPCASEFRTPAGINILRDAPHDHLHHHALMYAIAVDGVNFWEETGAPGTQAHRSFSGVGVGADASRVHRATLTETLDWIGPVNETTDTRLYLRESRTLTLLRAQSPEVSLLTWRSRFTLPPDRESATLSGAHYFGLGLRFVESMDEAGEFRFAAGAKGETVRGSEQNTAANWCAYASTADGKPVTVAMFGHPDNPHGPTMWFSMTKPFAYISATLNLHQTPMVLRREQGPMSVVYAVALWDGQVETERIDALYRKWVGMADAQ